MLYIPCDEYYEKYLGDNCDRDCHNCFAEKTIYTNKKDLDLSGEIIIQNVTVEKGTQWVELFRNKTHIILKNINGDAWYISHEMFNKYFVE